MRRSASLQISNPEQRQRRLWMSGSRYWATISGEVTVDTSLCMIVVCSGLWSVVTNWV
jgi:hypothetical protein